MTCAGYFMFLNVRFSYIIDIFFSVTNIKQEPENDSVTYKPTPMPSYNPTPLALLNQKKSLPEPDYSVSYQPTPLKEIKREKEKKVKQNWL